MNETYYYGQGKVYLARRGDDGRPGAWRWLGDVSELVITLAFEQKISKMSRGGRVFNSRRFVIGHSGTVTATWHNFSGENLAVLLLSRAINATPSIVESEKLPMPIRAGDRISLANQNVFGVDIAGLVKGRDYIVDSGWGVLDFITTPAQQPVFVEYNHAGSTCVPIIADANDEFALRYEGLNMAEQNTSVLVELYRLAYSPLASWQLINNGSSLAGIETSAELLFDPSAMSDNQLGQFGRVVMLQALNGITHNGKIYHNGKFTHGGN